MRGHFTLDPRIIYLNSGSHSICPDAVLDAIQRNQRDFELNPTRQLFLVWSKLWEAQKRLASFFRADPGDLFMRSNITLVMNEVILGPPLPRNSEILTTDLEYGAVYNICRHRAQRDGLALRSFALPAKESELKCLTEDRLLEQVISQIRPETKMLVISHVMTGTGLLMPIARIAAETRRLGILLVVDGAHSAGAIELRFDELEDVDFYGANLHKWMLGPKGTSFGWVAKRHQETLQPTLAGWCTFETSGYFAGFGAGSRFQSRFLMVGARDFSPFLAIPESISFWERLGPAAIRSKLAALSRKLMQLMDEKTGWPRLTPEAPGLRGPLLSYEPPEPLQRIGGQLMEELCQTRGLQVSTPLVRGRLCVRLSPHVYNTDEELARAAELLKTAAVV